MGIKIDKQEKKWKNRKIFKKVESILNEEFKDQNGYGLSKIYWARKKQLLKENGIDWKTPAELNRDIVFE